MLWFGTRTRLAFFFFSRHTSLPFLPTSIGFVVSSRLNWKHLRNFQRACKFKWKYVNFVFLGSLIRVWEVWSRSRVQAVIRGAAQLQGPQWSISQNSKKLSKFIKYRKQGYRKLLIREEIEGSEHTNLRWERQRKTEGFKKINCYRSVTKLILAFVKCHPTFIASYVF